MAARIFIAPPQISNYTWSELMKRVFRVSGSRSRMGFSSASGPGRLALVSFAAGMTSGLHENYSTARAKAARIFRATSFAM